MNENLDTASTAATSAPARPRSRRRETEGLRWAENEPIAVVGIGCRLPGGADSPEKFWQLLRGQVDAVTEVPEDRWSGADYDPTPGTAGKSYSRHGAFVDRVDHFDPGFFGISPREA